MDSKNRNSFVITKPLAEFTQGGTNLDTEIRLQRRPRNEQDTYQHDNSGRGAHEPLKFEAQVARFEGRGDRREGGRMTVELPGSRETEQHPVPGSPDGESSHEARDGSLQGVHPGNGRVDVGERTPEEQFGRIS